MKAVHEILMEKRKEQKIQQKYIVLSLNSTAPKVSMYEHGRLTIPADMFVKWANLLGLELSDFCNCGKRKMMTDEKEKQGARIS